MPKEISDIRLNHKLHQVIKNHNNVVNIINYEHTTSEQLNLLLDLMIAYANDILVKEKVVLALLNNKLFDEQIYQKIVAFILKATDRYTSLEFLAKQKTSSGNHLSRTQRLEFIFSIIHLMNYESWQEKYIPERLFMKCSFWSNKLRAAKAQGGESLRKALVEYAQSDFTSPKLKQMQKIHPSNLLEQLSKHEKIIKEQRALYLLSEQKPLRDLAFNLKGA